MLARRKKQIKISLDRNEIVVSILSSIFFASFISPQIALFGRGLRLSLLTAILLFGYIFLIKAEAYLVLKKYIYIFIIGFVFIMSGAIRYFWDQNNWLLRDQVLSPLISILILVVILIIRNTFVGSIWIIRWLTLAVLAMSLGMGIPLLIEQPNIARLTMGLTISNDYMSMLFSKGVGNYGFYNPVAISFAVIANWLYKYNKSVIIKSTGYLFLLVASFATLLSSFMMATVFLIFSIISFLVIFVVKSKKRAVKVISIVMLVIIWVACPIFIGKGLEIGSTRFVLDKIYRMFGQNPSDGFLEFDETGRVDMFIDSIKTFSLNPIFGSWGFNDRTVVGEHSSWADVLASQGIIGLLLWLGFIFPTLRRNKHPLSVETGAAGGSISWTLYFIGGLLNPTFFSPINLLFLWLYDEDGIWKDLPLLRYKELPRCRKIDRK